MKARLLKLEQKMQSLVMLFCVWIIVMRLHCGTFIQIAKAVFTPVRGMGEMS